MIICFRQYRSVITIGMGEKYENKTDSSDPDGSAQLIPYGNGAGRNRSMCSLS